MENLNLDVDSEQIPVLSFEEELSEDFSYFPEREEIKEVFPNFKNSEENQALQVRFRVLQELEIQSLKELIDYVGNWIDNFDTPMRKKFMESKHYQFYQWMLETW